MATAPSAASSSPSSSILEPVALRGVACQQCRKRKSFCSRERPQCSRCRDSAQRCVYAEGRKITISESYLRELERKVRTYEEAAISHPRLDPGQGPARTPASVSEDNEDEIENEHPLLEPFTQLSLDLPGRPSTSFKGPGSSDSFLRSVWKLSAPHGDDASLDKNANFFDPGALPSRRLYHARNHVRLPPVGIARRLFAAQYTYIGTIFFFTDPEAFEQLLAEAYRGGPPDLVDREACLSYAKVLMILAFGQLYSINQWVDFRGPPGFDYFTEALALLPDAHEPGSILCVETLAYVGYFLQNLNRRDAAFLYIGMALRMAISLGLHQEVSDPRLSVASRELRRRVWWSIYSLDRILSVKSGNPLAILDEDVGVAMPSPLPGEPVENGPAVVLRHYTELSRILGEIGGFVYRRSGATARQQSGSSLIASVQSIMQSLSRWRAALPPDLRLDPSSRAVSRESVSTFLHYYQCINMTARPLLFEVVQKRLRAVAQAGSAEASLAEKERDWRAGLSPTTVRVVETCISAAQDTIHAMTLAAQRDLVATYGYMDGEHAFSAAIVLVMVCGAFPTDARNTFAMNAGLQLLRGMGQRGNSHMGSRYESLAHLKALIVPGASAAEEALALAPAPAPRSNSNSSHPMIFSTTPTSPSSDSPWTTGLGTSMNANDTRLEGTPPSSITAPIPIPMFSNNVFGPSSFEPSDILSFPLVDNAALEEMFYDANNVGALPGEDDLGLWEEGFANPAGFDISQWTQATQMAVDQGP